MISSPICAWPACTARLISLALNSEPLAWTVILSLPPVASLTSLANCWMFSVWKLLAGYGRGHVPGGLGVGGGGEAQTDQGTGDRLEQRMREASWV